MLTLATVSFFTGAAGIGFHASVSTQMKLNGRGMTIIPDKRKSVRTPILKIFHLNEERGARSFEVCACGYRDSEESH